MILCLKSKLSATNYDRIKGSQRKETTMDIDASDVINRLSQELVQAVQAKVIAEAQLESAMKKIQELEESNDGS